MIKRSPLCISNILAAHQRKPDPKTDPRGDGRAGRSRDVAECAPRDADAVGEEVGRAGEGATKCGGKQLSGWFALLFRYTPGNRLHVSVGDNGEFKQSPVAKRTIA